MKTRETKESAHEPRPLESHVSAHPKHVAVLFLELDRIQDSSQVFCL